MLRRVRAIQSILSQLMMASRKAADIRSFARFACDVLLLHLLRLLRLSPSNRERQIRLRGDICLNYRLNSGDLQSIREVWLDNSYELPFLPKPGALVDLGANIGLTSVWLAKRYSYSTIIAVEPSSANARLARMNFADNNIQVELIEGAIGPVDGTVLFETDEASNVGRVGSTGRAVQMVSMQTALKLLPAGMSVGLVKMDIEGGEEALLQGDPAWLLQVHSVIVEFHPQLIDYKQAIETLRRAGFRYIAAGSAHMDSMDSFVREP